MVDSEPEKSGGERLLYVVNVPWYFAGHWLPLAKAARDAGYSVEIASGPGPGAEVIRAEGFTVHTLAMSRSGLSLLGELQALRGLYRRLRPALVHHITIKPVLLGGLAARLARVPGVLHTLPGLGFMFTASGARARLGRCAVLAGYRLAFAHPRCLVVCMNKDDLGELTDAGVLGAGQGRVIRGVGVDIVKFGVVAEPTGIPVVALIGRMLADKGVGEFVAAAGSLKTSGVRARFVLIGDPDPGNPTSVSPDTLKAWQQDGVVEWWGHRHDMPEVLAKLHIVCLPSYREGLGAVLVEAAACARALVASDVPGCREVVREGVNGLLVPPRDPGRLAEALRRLITDPALRARMALRAREIAVAEFALERVLAEHLTLYRKLLCQ
jgi:glycosyltransferase involved in cell wall biosynthesis